METYINEKISVIDTNIIFDVLNKNNFNKVCFFYTNLQVKFREKIECTPEKINSNFYFAKKK